MRIASNVSNGTDIYTKLTSERLNELRTMALLGMGERLGSGERVFELLLPTWRTKPGNKRENVKLTLDPSVTAYNFNNFKRIKINPGMLTMWEIVIW